MINGDNSEAKAKPSEPVDLVQNGEEHVLDEARKPGALKGQIQIASDFDTLPSDMEAAFGVI